MAGSAAAASAALITGAVVLAYVDRHRVHGNLTSWDFSDVFAHVTSLGVPVVGFVLASRRPANRLGWLFLGAGLGLGLSFFSTQYAQHALVAVPGSWPAGRAVAWFANWIWAIPYALLAFVFLLFPTGRLLSPRWRVAAWSVAGANTLAVADLIAYATRIWWHPFVSYRPSSNPPDVNVAIVLMIVAAAVGVAAVVVRFTHSSGEERLQLKWFAAAALLVIVTIIPSFLTDRLIFVLLGSLALLCLWVAVGIAVLKYRLGGIDIVISKAVLYGSLAVFITAVYAGLVVGVGALAGGRDSPLVAALAAAVVAVAFQPVRQRAGRLANRVVYGRRATPYQVLSDFAQRIGSVYASQDVLPQMAQIVAAGTGAEQVVVWLRVDDELRPEASSDGSPAAASPPVAAPPVAAPPVAAPPVAAPLVDRLSAPPSSAEPLPLDPLPVDGQVMPPVPGADLSVPVVHQGELLGAIAVQMPRDEPLRPAGEQLVADVASQAGLVLSNAALVGDLRASRQRLVTAQDEARRRLERNIHDGAQQDLVALRIKLRLAGMTVDDDPAEAKEMLGELQADAAGALENLRDLARGIYPPLLADLGLVAALNAQAAKSPLPVTVDADGIGRFGQDTEAAVYFCCLEALQNIAKYAHATQASICLQARNGTLRFTVSDDGTGYDARHTPLGSGQRNMADRLAALGGRLEVRSAPGHGTTITAQLPSTPGGLPIAAHGG
ncbi:MAG TPA: histidine kinase [Streptosporangiaceae bacterium]|nr:histidine kinase [Streptosporangiaceae bacterium]